MYSHLVVIFFFSSALFFRSKSPSAPLLSQMENGEEVKKKLTNEQERKSKQMKSEAVDSIDGPIFFLLRWPTDAKRKCVAIRTRCKTRLDEISDSLSFSSIVSVRIICVWRTKKKLQQKTIEKRWMEVSDGMTSPTITVAWVKRRRTLAGAVRQQTVAYHTAQAQAAFSCNHMAHFGCQINQALSAIALVVHP